MFIILVLVKNLIKLFKDWKKSNIKYSKYSIFEDYNQRKRNFNEKI